MNFTAIIYQMASLPKK